MWAEAARWLNKFPEAVVTFADDSGYPASVRVATRAYDSATGELPVPLPDGVNGAHGPASLLCHSHDEKLWSLQMITVKGTFENRDGSWLFQSTGFEAPSKLAMLHFIRNTRGSAQRYLDKRGLQRPDVNWAAVKDVQRRANG